MNELKGVFLAAAVCGFLRLFDIAFPPHYMPWPVYALFLLVGTIGYFGISMRAATGR